MESSQPIAFGTQLIASIWPLLLGLLVSLFVLWVLCRLARVRFSTQVLTALHQDQRGGVQSLSFVLTVPLFIFVMMFIVQLSQITIGQIGVEYAAFSAARSAIVWIPARAEPGQGENQIGQGLEFLRLEAWHRDEQLSFDVNAYVLFGIVPPTTTHIYAVYEVSPGGVKYEKIRSAAAMALMNVCPSRQVVDSRTTASASANWLVDPLEKAYMALAPSEQTNPRVPDRIRNKLEYALEHTLIRIEIRHKDSAAFLDEHDIREDRAEFRLNEVDWQDQVIVDVFHEFALLPGPGRLLARRADARPGTEVDESYEDGQSRDRIAAQIQRRYSNTYVFPLKASARLTVEGFKPWMIDTQPSAALEPYRNQTSPDMVAW